MRPNPKAPKKNPGMMKIVLVLAAILAAVAVAAYILFPGIFTGSAAVSPFIDIPIPSTENIAPGDPFKSVPKDPFKVENPFELKNPFE